MFKVLAQDGTTQLHLDTSHGKRAIRVSSTEPLEALAITVAVEDLPGIALGLLKANPHLLANPQLSAAVKTLTDYAREQQAKQEKTRLRERQDALAVSFYEILYYQLSLNAQNAINRIIELEDKLEVAK